MGIKRVSVIGLGTLGTQISIQAAHYGYDVTAYDQDPQVFRKTIEKVKGVMAFLKRSPTMPQAEWEKAESRVKMAGSIEESLEQADLVIEAIPENLEMKRSLFARMDEIAPREAIFATNSSSIPVSRIEGATRRPERCLNLHFYAPAVSWNIVDVMSGAKTDPDVLHQLRQFVRSIQCVPLTVHKEILGFCFNSVWRAVKRQTLYLWGEGFVDFRDIDRSWMIMFTPTHGPFFLMDFVGLDVVYAIEMSYYSESKDPKDQPPKSLLEKIERKELGVKTGKGFYTYPDPEFRRPDFLAGKARTCPKGFEGSRENQKSSSLDPSAP
jgi:3-hydroxybutyryl-CoA dehydrogenase